MHSSTPSTCASLHEPRAGPAAGASRAAEESPTRGGARGGPRGHPDDAARLVQAVNAQSRVLESILAQLARLANIAQASLNLPAQHALEERERIGARTAAAALAGSRRDGSRNARPGSAPVPAAAVGRHA